MQGKYDIAVQLLYSELLHVCIYCSTYLECIGGKSYIVWVAVTFIAASQ